MKDKTATQPRISRTHGSHVCTPNTQPTLSTLYQFPEILAHNDPPNLEFSVCGPKFFIGAEFVKSSTPRTRNRQIPKVCSALPILCPINPDKEFLILEASYFSKLASRHCWLCEPVLNFIIIN